MRIDPLAGVLRIVLLAPPYKFDHVFDGSIPGIAVGSHSKSSTIASREGFVPLIPTRDWRTCLVVACFAKATAFDVGQEHFNAAILRCHALSQVGWLDAAIKIVVSAGIDLSFDVRTRLVQLFVIRHTGVCWCSFIGATQ